MDGQENLGDPSETSKEQTGRLLEIVDKDKEQGSLFKEHNRDCFSQEGDAKIQI